jgi:hypothetical protein
LLLAVQPRRAHEVARALSRVSPGTEAECCAAVLATLDRLRDGGLVRRRAAATECCTRSRAVAEPSYTSNGSFGHA